jgi:hypothetical protein
MSGPLIIRTRRVIKKTKDLGQARERGDFAMRDTGTKANRLIRMFGGVTRMSQVTGFDKAIISRWDATGKRGGGGNVPARYNTTIISAAEKCGLDLKAVGECLPEAVCPTCGQPLEPGQHINH